MPHVPDSPDVEELRARVENLASLPTLPGVVQLITQMVSSDDTSARDVGELISRDQVLSSKVLKLVNSPVYGFPGRISSVNHALVLLGFNVVKGLVLSAAVFDSLAEQTSDLWEHSLGTAIISRRLARELGTGDPEEVMIAGLLHDLGKVVMRHLDPERCDAVARTTSLSNQTIAEAERHIFGVDHTTFGAWITEYWHLPPRLGEALMYHHKPMKAQHSFETAAIVHLADILARGMGFGDGGDNTMPPIDHEAFELLKVSDKIIATVIAASDEEFHRGVSMFNMRTHSA